MNQIITLAAWNEFVTTGRIMPQVSPLVSISWLRCRPHLNPTRKVRLNRLNLDHLLAAQVASFDVISIARPVMEDIFQNIDSANIAIVLLNSTGYILDLIAGAEMQKSLDNSGITKGVIFTEDHVGTNALGLALTARMPVQILGPEHFIQQYHEFATAAAPVFDITGRPLGVLGYISYASEYQSNSLGLMAAGAKAIEAQRQADQLMEEQNSHLAQLNAILDTISEGIVVWNRDHVLMHINQYASRLAKLPVTSLLGSRLGSIVNYPKFIYQAIEKGEALTDVETHFTIQDRGIHCLLSLRFVYNKSDLEWVITSFRPIKEVRKLIQHQVGANAQLTLDDIPGESVQAKRVRAFVKSAAPTVASILITGESGTGKNVLARAIHNESPRRDNPFVIFSCSSVPNELVISELLGYESGYFPRRSVSRPSKFELAQGGTIYFQNVDALPLEAQASLLNVIELHMVQRLGGERAIEIDVRIIASTSARIERLIAEGRFRSDLYYRLKTFTVHLPALRDRPRDIPIIVNHILGRLSNQLGYPVTLAPGVIEVLKKYQWPGNIRELESVLGPAAIQAGAGNLIEQVHLPPAVRLMSGASLEDEEPVQIRSLEEVERESIQQTAQVWAGNITRMAKALGIGRTTLWRKIKKYEIVIDSYRSS